MAWARGSYFKKRAGIEVREAGRKLFCFFFDLCVDKCIRLSYIPYVMAKDKVISVRVSEIQLQAFEKAGKVFSNESGEVLPLSEIVRRLAYAEAKRVIKEAKR